MELKFIIKQLFTIVIKSFNRTFMELKFQITIKQAERTQVLIVPLWN